MAVLQGVAELLRTGTAEEVEAFKETVSLLANSLVDEIQAQQLLLEAERGELALTVARINSLTLLCDARGIYVNHDVCIGRLLEVDPLSEVVIFFSDARLVRRVLGGTISFVSTPEQGTVLCASYPRQLTPDATPAPT